MNTHYIFSFKFFLILSFCFLFSSNANAQTSFSHGIISGSPSLVWFKPDTNIAWVDIHFDAGSGARNVRMKANAATGRFEQEIEGANAGTAIQYSFTYSINGSTAFDTNIFNAVFGSASSSSSKSSSSNSSIFSTSKSSQSSSSSTKSSSSKSSSSSSTINSVTQGVDDRSTFVIIWLKPNAVIVDWADIHFNINNSGQQNVRMTFNTANARFEQIINTANNSPLSIVYSFTHQTLQGAVDTASFNFSRASSSSLSSKQSSSSSKSSISSTQSSSSSKSSIGSSSAKSSSKSSLSSNSSTSSSVSSARSSSSVSSIAINVDRSLIVHDEATLQAADFSFRSTLQQLTNQFNAQNPGNPTNVEQLFSRWWDTLTPTPGNVTGGEKCTGVFNNFAVECRPAEGSQANNPAFFINSYIPIALINRFDLRDTTNFNDCGEYRIIYASKSGLRNFIIFEAQVSNPSPGVASGCLAIVQFWKNLSAENDTTARATKLRSFYFEGIPSENVGAVISVGNYTFGHGQIRTNMFMGSSWDLKEFKTSIDSQGLSIIVPVTVKSNPVAFLFDGNNTDSRAREFQNDFINNIGNLLGDFNTFSLVVERDTHNNGQSHASGDVSENAFSSAFFNTNTNNFQQTLNNKLASVGSNLTPTQVMNRATAMTCGGCHQPDAFGLTSPNTIGPGKSWPTTLGFVHVNEFPFNGVFLLSPALNEVFLPARLIDLNNFISSNNTQSAQRVAPLKTSTITVNAVQGSSSSSTSSTTQFHKRAG
jgi:hypothetical protein